MLLERKIALLFVFVVCIILFFSFAIKALGMLSINSVLIADVDTEYNRVLILNGIDKNTGKKTINLVTDPYGVQGAVFEDGTQDLVFDYLKMYRMAWHFVPSIKNALTVGGCVYAQPRDLLRQDSQVSLDVVEIDPGMTNVAKKYFGLTSNPRMSIVHEDGRIFLNNNKKKYDAIFIDAFNSASSVPFHLTTIEAVKKIYSSLNDNGVVMMNIISAIDGTSGKFLQAEYVTYKNVFDNVYVFQIHKENDPALAQNIMLVAAKSTTSPRMTSDDSEINGYLQRLWTKEIQSDVPILTDDYAPVEYYKRLSI